MNADGGHTYFVFSEVNNELSPSGISVTVRDIAYKDPSGRTLLMEPSIYKHTQAVWSVDYLIAHGVNPAVQDKFGRTALMYAAAYSFKPFALKSLINAGAAINAKDQEGITPLMYAVENENTEILEFLLKNGADVMAKTVAGKTALSLAKDKASRSGLDFGSSVTHLLIKAGAKE